MKKNKGPLTMEMEASENPALDSIKADPTLVATAFRKNRFYLFTRRDATDTKSVDTDRDVFNEKPSKEDIIAATEQGGGKFHKQFIYVFIYKKKFTSTVVLSLETTTVITIMMWIRTTLT